MKRRHEFSVQIFRLSAFGCAFLTIAVFWMMLYLGWPLLSSGQFFSLITQEWLPRQEIYGIYPMLVGSIAIAFLSVCLSLPISLGTAFAAATLAPRRLRKVLLTMVRFMAGIPTVVYGFVAVFLLVPFIREQLTGGSGFTLLSASIVLALLIAPTMIVFFVNGLGNVDRHHCMAVDALGAKPVQKLLYLQLPQAWPTMIAGIIMGAGRAMGDTLISLMLAGNSVAVPQGVADSGRTLTAHIALVIAADFDSIEFRSIFACGLVLYVFSVIAVILLRHVATVLGRQTG